MSATILPSNPTSDASAGGYQTGANAITYMGMPAVEIVTTIKSLNLAPGFDLASSNLNLDFQENGVLNGFTVAVNDPGIEVDCFIYGSDGNSTALQDFDMQFTAALSRGLTHEQAISVGPLGQSLDPVGTPDPDWPWLRRYRFTFSLAAIKANLTYPQVAGTFDDAWIVLSYTPLIKKGYTRLYMNLNHISGTGPFFNNTEQNAIIHFMQVSRIKFNNSANMQYTTGSANLAREQMLTFG